VSVMNLLTQYGEGLAFWSIIALPFLLFPSWQFRTRLFASFVFINAIIGFFKMISPHQFSAYRPDEIALQCASLALASLAAQLLRRLRRT
jgi:hypothetical protein